MLFFLRVSFPRQRAAMLILTASACCTGCLSDKTKSVDRPATCAKAGDQCTFSPGKLGLCVHPADDAPSLVCESLH